MKITYEIVRDAVTQTIEYKIYFYTLCITFFVNKWLYILYNYMQNNFKGSRKCTCLREIM